MSANSTVDDISTGGQRYLPHEGRVVARAGLRAHQAHREVHRQELICQNIRAFRLELLNDPNLPLGGPGRSIKGTGALTEFRSRRPRPRDAPDQSHQDQDRPARRPTSTRPRRPLEPIFDDKSGKRRVTGPIEFAIDGKDETAWGIDAGPGRRNQPRKAVFVAEKRRSTFAGGAVLNLYPEAEPRRLEQRRQPEQQPRPLPALRHHRRRTPRPTRCPPSGARRSSPSRAAALRPAQTRAVFTYWRTTVARVEGGERAHRGALEAASGGLVATGAGGAPRTDHARHPHAPARRLPEAGREAGRPGRARVPEPAAPGVDATRSPAFAPAGWSTASRPTTARAARQPRLAGLLRHRPRRHRGGPGPQCERAVASRTARLAGRRVHGPRLEPEEAAPADRDLGHLPAVVARDAGAAGEGSRQPPAGARAAVPRRRRDRPRHRARRQRPAQSRKSAARASFRPRPASCSSRRPATAQELERRRRAPTATAARSTRSAYRCVPYPMLQTFDAPNGDLRLRAPLPAPTRRCRRSRRSTSRSSSNPPQALAGRALQGRRRHRCRAPGLCLPPLRCPPAQRRRKRSAARAARERAAPDRRWLA